MEICCLADAPSFLEHYLCAIEQDMSYFVFRGYVTLHVHSFFCIAVHLFVRPNASMYNPYNIFDLCHSYRITSKRA